MILDNKLELFINNFQNKKMSRSQALDRFSEDISVMSKNEQDVKNLLADRKAMIAKGGQTGIVRTLINKGCRWITN